MYLWNQLCQKSTSSILPLKDVLSQSNKQNCISLLNSMKPIDAHIKNNQKKAAVLVPLCEIDKQVGLLYTVRAKHLKVNGGQVAFPGGMFDESDGSLEKTALRETHEEIGINPNEVEIWGKGPEIFRKDVRVTPFLGFIGTLDMNKLKINYNEVSLVFPATLDHLSSVQNFRTTQFRFGKFTVYKMPVYEGTATRVWGLTAVITHIVLSALIPEHYGSNINFKPTVHKVLRPKKKVVAQN